MNENKNNALTDEQLEEVSGGDIRTPTPTFDPDFNEPGPSFYANDGNCGNSVRVKNGKCQETLCGTTGDEHICVGCKYHK